MERGKRWFLYKEGQKERRNTQEGDGRYLWSLIHLFLVLFRLLNTSVSTLCLAGPCFVGGDSVGVDEWIDFGRREAEGRCDGMGWEVRKWEVDVGMLMDGTLVSAPIEAGG